MIHSGCFLSILANRLFWKDTSLIILLVGVILQILTMPVFAADYEIFADSYYENTTDIWFTFSSYPSTVFFSINSGCGTLNPTVKNPDDFLPPYNIYTTYTPCEIEGSTVTIKADPTSAGSNQYATIYLIPRIDIDSGEQDVPGVYTYDADTGLPTSSYVYVSVIPPEAGSVSPSSGLSEYNPLSGEYEFFSTYTAGSYEGRVRVKFRIDNPFPHDDSVVIYSYDQLESPLTVISPNGGESFQQGENLPISWSPGDNPTSYDIRIELYKESYVSRTITTGTSDDGSYNWSIPDSLSPGSDYKIEVSSKSDPTSMDKSDDNFSITQRPTIPKRNIGH